MVYLVVDELGVPCPAGGVLTLRPPISPKAVCNRGFGPKNLET